MVFGKASLKNRALTLIWLLELLLVMAAVAGAAWLRFMNDPEGHEIFSENLAVRAFLVAMFVTTAMAALGLYEVHVRLNRFEFVLRLLVSFAIGGIGLMVLYYLVPRGLHRPWRDRDRADAGAGLAGACCASGILQVLRRRNCSSGASWCSAPATTPT